MMGPHDAEVVWPSKFPGEKSRIHNHHISLRERIKEFQNRTQGKHPKSEVDVYVTRKAAAWAVFQHHGGGGVGLTETQRSAVRRPTRFKIEAQMKDEIARPSVSESGAAGSDIGSSLFDSFELDSLLKALDQAVSTAGTSQQRRSHEATSAIAVYSQKHWIFRPDLHLPQRYNNKLQGQRSFQGQGAIDDGRLPSTVDEMRPLKTADSSGPLPVSYKLPGNLTLDDLYKKGQEDAESDPFANFGHTPSPFNVRRSARRSFDSSLQEKSGKSRDLHHRSKWKSLLHTLHLDSSSGLFNRFQGFHAQVAPYDSHKKLENRGSRSRAKARARFDQMDGTYTPKHSIVRAQTEERFDPRFDPKKLQISKDVHRLAMKDDHQRSSPAQSWKFALKAVLSRPFIRQGSSLGEKSESSAFGTLETPRKSDDQRGRKKADLQTARSSLTSKHQHHQVEHEQGREHRNRTVTHHSSEEAAMKPISLSYHVPPEAADYELTIQAISRRVSRSSFDETARNSSKAA